MIIGFAGKAGSGKSTAASYLTTHKGFTEYQFALPIKECLAHLFGVPLSSFEDAAFKNSIIPNTDVTYRHAMQTLGTDWGRNAISKDIWLLIAQQRLSQIKGNVVITDVRFDNEAQLIRSLGGYIIHIERTGSDYWNIREGNHESEAGITHEAGDLYIKNQEGNIHAIYGELARTLHLINAFNP